MQDTKQNSEKQKSNTAKLPVVKAPSTASGLRPRELERESSPQESLSDCVTERLLYLMKAVTKDEVSPSTVKAACECAQQMYNIMKLSLAMKNQGF